MVRDYIETKYVSSFIS